MNWPNFLITVLTLSSLVVFWSAMGLMMNENINPYVGIACILVAAILGALAVGVATR